jgi:hypothetical protein
MPTDTLVAQQLGGFLVYLAISAVLLILAFVAYIIKSYVDLYNATNEERPCESVSDASKE